MKSVTQRLAAGAIVPLMLSLALPAGAKQVRGEDFEKGRGEMAVKATDTQLGRGWRSAIGGNTSQAADMLRLPAAGLVSPAGGTIEIDAVRNNTEDSSEALFALVDAGGKVLLSVSVEWDGAGVAPTPLLEIGADGRIVADPLWTTALAVRDMDEQVTYQALRFPSKIGTGGAFHLSFTWGRNRSDCAFFVNGVEARGDQSRTVAGDLRLLIEQAEWLYIGGEPRGLGPGANNLMTSLVKSVHVYDQPIDGRDLHANPEKYRAGALPTIASLQHDAFLKAGFSGRLVAGNAVSVTMSGTPGATASFDLVHYPDVDARVALDWRGWGVYLEDKTFYEPGEVNLRDVKGYEVYAATSAFDPAAPGFEPTASLKPDQQSHTLTFLEINRPYYIAVLAVMSDGTRTAVLSPVRRRPMSEATPGSYVGSLEIGALDRYARAVFVGRLASAAGAETTLVGEQPFAVDTALALEVVTDPSVLMANEKDTAKVTVTVRDANGNPVSGHKIKFLLATTSQYTGVVGGGAFTEQVGGSLKESFRGETDLFGRLTATYVAGFAAKTAVIVARDMASNSTGAGYVRTYIQAKAQLELEPVQQPAADAGYDIAVTSSDKWLTADGKSQARITAVVTLNGKPIEGHTVNFGVSSGSGSVRTVKGTTDRGGTARALYTAGTKIGVAVVTATDVTVGISGSVSIELRSDAPAKIAVTVDPGRLPADGRSRADLRVLVTDINDNPNENVEVEYRLSGSGSLRDERGVTDRRGENTVEYRAGRTPGTVSFEITVRSTVPTDEELATARGLAVAVTDYDFF